MKFPWPLRLCLAFIFLPFFSNAGIVVLNGLTHQYDVISGETYRGQIEIQNTSDIEQAVKLYQRDYSFNFKGEAFYEESGTNERSNAGWLDISPKYLKLQPKEKKLILFEVNVPKEEQMTGTFWSVIMVEGEMPIDTNNLDNGLNVQTQIRYAIQIATTFNNEGERNLTFYDVNLEKENGQHFVVVDIENKGEFLFKPDVSIELFNEEGKSIGVFTSTKKKIYPDTSARFYVSLDRVQIGNYQSLILADCGDEDIFGINVDLEISDD